MLERLEQMKQRYSLLEAKLNEPATYADVAQVTKLNQEQRELQPIMEAYGRYGEAKAAMDEAAQLLSEPDEELRELAKEEYQSAKKQVEALERELQILLLPKDPDDNKNVIVEIRAGVGGEESALFAHSLYRMYSMYCDKKGWSLDIANVNETELGGCKEITFTVHGQGVYARLKYESGVHRVQRVPETESGGRVHTSTATVAVMPEVDEVTFELDRNDLRIDTFRSSGAGGQHINKTSSAIRVTHIPTGMVVECQDQRSQFQNKDKALEILRARLYQQKVQEQQDSIAADRRSKVGTGMRNERIRTYNFPQGRMTDHRIGLTLYKLESVLDGSLDEIIDALASAEQAEKLAHGER